MSVYGAISAVSIYTNMHIYLHVISHLVEEYGLEETARGSQRRQVESAPARGLSGLVPALQNHVEYLRERGSQNGGGGVSKKVVAVSSIV